MKPKNFAVKVLLLAAGTLLFSLCQPSALCAKGIAPLAFVALVPYFVLAKRTPLKTAVLWGGLYGTLANTLLVFWLFKFSVPAFIGIAVLYFCFFALLTPALRLSYRVFGKNAFLADWVLYNASDFLRNKGFLGFAYGTMGYSQWRCVPLIQSASLFGVWVISALVVFPSAFLAQSAASFDGVGGVKGFLRHTGTFFREKRLWCWLYIGIFVLSVLPFYNRGTPSGKNYKIALIQPNSDPWKNSSESYRGDLDTLVRLSDGALESAADISLVVWPETAFVPRIKWHYRFRQSPEMYAIVDELLTYLDKASVPFLIGNDEALYDERRAGAGEDLEAGRVDYNAAQLFVPKQNVRPPEPDVYYKQHLVPFTENFPYKEAFPQLYAFLRSRDTHLYEAGSEATVFEVNGLKFAVPICFEDNFGTLTRRFVQNGAQCLINISNDAWSGSLACQMQHLSTSVFRAVETGCPVLRATANGYTCVINEKGRIVQRLDPFCEGALVADCTVPDRTENSTTFYVRVGDIFGWFEVIAAVCVIAVIFLQEMKEKKSGKK